jgi:hypothetical protein
MTGKIKEMIDKIIKERGKENQAIIHDTRAKLALKGIIPSKYDENSEDDEVIIEKIKSVAKQWNINL